MRTRGVGIAALVLAALMPSASIGQQSTKIPQVGFLQADAPDYLIDAFRDGLRALGYVEERDIVLEARWAHGHFDRLPKLDDLWHAIETTVAADEWFSDVHGSAPYKRHLTFYYAEQILRELGDR